MTMMCMAFDYEQSIWGAGEATLHYADPASFRLLQALDALARVKEGRVLEVGCGAGQFIRAIKRARPELECCGCDISAAAVAKAKETGEGVRYDQSLEVELPYVNVCFDAVLVFDVLEHAQNTDALLAEINRVLAPGGVFYCFVPCEGDWLSLWNLLRKLNIKPDLTKKYAGHINYFSRCSLYDLLKKNNFRLKQLRYSEHSLGQILGVLTFILMARAAKKQNISQMNNEAFFARMKHGSKFYSALKKVVNFLVNLESVLLCRVPSPNVHVISIKK
ncbi:class I SAM-dependent methyltransferase [Patescibacteria group bacterium]|nr:MAG: class I SAM-dependent methyltransferase [Patescibacteria group bacterium]